MADSINVLILSCGTRNKIMHYFKKELSGNGLVMGADCSRMAPALYEADKHFIVPRIDDERYLDAVLSICRENKVKAVISLIDPELNVISRNKEAFEKIGTIPVISDYDVVDMCYNKYSMYKFLISCGFKTMKSYTDKDEFYRDAKAGLISYPVLVKPVNGSASINVNTAVCEEEVEILFKRYDNLMIQEYLDGTEYGADAYIDLLTGELAALFVKKKIKMRAGETDKSVSVKDDELFGLLEKFVKKANLKGIVDIDIFGYNGEYYISEVNPRFGGGFPHAYECGVNMVKMIINNIQGRPNKASIGQYKEGVCMMKYNEIKIIDG